jgi:hypothetical protein
VVVGELREEVAGTRSRLAAVEDERRHLGEQLSALRQDNARLKRELERGAGPPLEPTLDQSIEATAQVDPARNPAALQERAREIHERLTRILRGIADATAQLNAELKGIRPPISSNTVRAVDAIRAGTAEALATIQRLKSLIGFPVDD